MDGIHDLGGLSGFGEVDVKSGEPTFHERWEAIAFAPNALGISVLRAYNVDEYRHAVERMEPRRYLAASYCERAPGSIPHIALADTCPLAEQCPSAKHAAACLSRGAKAHDRIESAWCLTGDAVENHSYRPDKYR